MHRAVALAAALNAAAGLRDLVVFRLSDAYGEQTWLRYSSAAFGVTLAYIVLHRFRTASTKLRELSASLAARVAQKEAELAKTYGQMTETARKQARAAERTRILRDMHDGVGSHLSSAIRQLESGRAEPEQVLRTLRDSLDQLKLSIDAIHLPPGDLTALLANLRYRLEPRFAALDTELEWHVDDLPAVPGIDGGAMRQLQYMLFEALSNVLQHAQARCCASKLPATGAGPCCGSSTTGADSTSASPCARACARCTIAPPPSARSWPSKAGPAAPRSKLCCPKSPAEPGVTAGLALARDNRGHGRSLRSPSTQAAPVPGLSGL
jgi:signal transduction histidine kinase